MVARVVGITLALTIIITTLYRQWYVYALDNTSLAMVALYSGGASGLLIISACGNSHRKSRAVGVSLLVGSTFWILSVYAWWIIRAALNSTL